MRIWGFWCYDAQLVLLMPNNDQFMCIDDEFMCWLKWINKMGSVACCWNARHMSPAGLCGYKLNCVAPISVRPIGDKT